MELCPLFTRDGDSCEMPTFPAALRDETEYFGMEFYLAKHLGHCSSLAIDFYLVVYIYLGSL